MKITGLPANWSELSRDEMIYHEELRLAKILKDVPKEQVALCARLIERAAFMLVVLIEYEKIITASGVITSMSQGQYEIDRENPAVKGYNALIKNYQAVVKQMIDLLPDKAAAVKEKAGEKLAAFVARGKR